MITTKPIIWGGKAGILEIVTTNSGEGVNMSGNLTVEGDFVVNGNTTNKTLANLLVEDRFILLNSGSDVETVV